MRTRIASAIKRVVIKWGKNGGLSICAIQKKRSELIPDDTKLMMKVTLSAIKNLVDLLMVHLSRMVKIIATKAAVAFLPAARYWITYLA